MYSYGLYISAAKLMLLGVSTLCEFHGVVSWLNCVPAADASALLCRRLYSRSGIRFGWHLDDVNVAIFGISMLIMKH